MYVPGIFINSIKYCQIALNKQQRNSRTI
uniref:Uncharacterized protein n=1 Tax=Arundo donax TaxID=35708 RepID=A0A0A9A2Q7_ARUDO